MEIRGLTLNELEAIAASTPVRLYNPRVIRITRKGEVRVRLQLHTAKDKKGRVVYGRLGFHRRKDGERTRLAGPVCWHGHRDFLKGVFDSNPEAVVISKFARYDGLDSFELLFPNTANVEVGSQHDPVTFGDLCECAEGCYVRMTKKEYDRMHANAQVQNRAEDIDFAADRAWRASYFGASE